MSVISPTEQPTPELIITPQQHQNQWLYEFSNSTLYLTTLETTGGRLKLTMQEQDTSTLYLKTYMCLLSMNELIELNTFFTMIDDIYAVEKIFTLIISNPSKVSIEICNNDKQQQQLSLSQSYIKFQLQLPTNKQRLLTLRLYCVREESNNIIKEREAMIKDGYERLEQKYFELGLQVKEMFNRNGMEWGDEIFPEDIMMRCKEKWLNEHVGEEFPKFDKECVFRDIKDMVNKIGVSDNEDEEEEIEDDGMEEKNIDTNNNNNNNDDNNTPMINDEENTPSINEENDNNTTTTQN